MTLDISSFGNAIQRLDEGVRRCQAESGDTQVRDGLIQRFEFTYELAHKTLKRYLDSTAPTPGEFAGADFQHLIRTASAQGLLQGEWVDWRRYRDMRAKTSHAYDEDVAVAVVAGIPEFLAEARFLHAQLVARLA